MSQSIIRMRNKLHLYSSQSFQIDTTIYESDYKLFFELNFQILFQKISLIENQK